MPLADIQKLEKSHEKSERELQEYELKIGKNNKVCATLKEELIALQRKCNQLVEEKNQGLELCNVS